MNKFPPLFLTHCYFPRNNSEIIYAVQRQTIVEETEIVQDLVKI